MKIKAAINYFSKAEILLWNFSVIMIVSSFIIFGGENYITLIASLIGATSLIFNAKGNPFGPFLMIVFSLMYGIISFTFSYYGEMFTYLGMTMPMSVFAFISWVKNPYEGNKSEVAVNRLKQKEHIAVSMLAILVTFIFYFILDYFDTANMIPSTISIATSFVGVYLTLRRNPYFAMWDAFNDIVLIILWIMASTEDISYVSVAVCFIIFLINDIYGFISWRRMEKRQTAAA